MVKEQSGHSTDAVISFAGYTLRQSARTVSDDTGVLPVGGRAFDLLLYLINHRHGIVSRAEAFRGVWGDTVLDQSNLNVQLAALRRVFGSDLIQTVPRRGLRFMPEVTGDSAADLTSLAVLPFAVSNQSAALDSLADGLTDDLTTELARYPDLLVIAANSARAVSNQASDRARSAKILNARYLVTGALRRVGNVLHLSVNLWNATSGATTWVQSYDFPANRRFDVIEEVVAELASAIGPQVWAAEANRLRRPAPRIFSAHDRAHRAWASIWPLEMTPDQTARDSAIGLANEVLAQDPACALAHRTIAYAKFWTLYFDLSPQRDTDLSDALAAAAAAIATDGLDHHAYRQKGLLHFLGGEPLAGMIDLRRAHALNPNCALTLSWLGLYEATHGNDTVAVIHAKGALRRSPLDPMRASLEVALAFTHFITADYHAACEAAKSAIEQRPLAATPYLIAAIARVGAGDLPGARLAFHRLNDIAPKMAAARLDGVWLSPKKDYRNRAQAFLSVAAGLMDPSDVSQLVQAGPAASPS